MRWHTILPIVSSVYIVAIFTLASGIFNGVLEGGNALFITRNRNVQTLGEVVLGIFIMSAGATAFYLIHKSVDKKIGVNKLMVVGFSILTLTLISLYALMIIKL